MAKVCIACGYAPEAEYEGEDCPECGTKESVKEGEEKKEEGGEEGESTEG